MNNLSYIKTSILTILLIFNCTNLNAEINIPSTINMGSVQDGSIITFKIPVKNSGKSVVKIAGTKAPCTCTTINKIKKSTINPNNIEYVTGRINTAKTQANDVTIAIFVEDNKRNAYPVKIYFQRSKYYTVKPNILLLKIPPNSKNVKGEIAIHKARHVDFDLKNTSNVPKWVSNMSINRDTSNVFHINLLVDTMNRKNGEYTYETIHIPTTNSEIPTIPLKVQLYHEPSMDCVPNALLIKLINKDSAKGAITVISQTDNCDIEKVWSDFESLELKLNTLKHKKYAISWSLTKNGLKEYKTNTIRGNIYIKDNCSNIQKIRTLILINKNSIKKLHFKTLRDETGVRSIKN